jgi:hypothetical protein
VAAQGGKYLGAEGTGVSPLLALLLRCAALAKGVVFTPLKKCTVGGITEYADVGANALAVFTLIIAIKNSKNKALVLVILLKNIKNDGENIYFFLKTDLSCVRTIL